MRWQIDITPYCSFDGYGSPGNLSCGSYGEDWRFYDEYDNMVYNLTLGSSGSYDEAAIQSTADSVFGAGTTVSFVDSGGYKVRIADLPVDAVRVEVIDMMAGAPTISSSANAYDPNPPPNFTVGASFSYEWGDAVTITPTVVTGTVDTWSITPALPSGLSLNTSTGVITGTAPSITYSDSHDLTATNESGEDTETFSLAITMPEGTLPSISLDGDHYSFNSGDAISIEPVADAEAGPVEEWSIAPALPDGLSINAGTGEISGTAPAIAISQVYTITATGEYGDDTVDFLLVIVPELEFDLQATVTLIKGVTEASIEPSVEYGSVDHFSISPALPSGLSFSTVTGIVSGVAVALKTETVYTITAHTAGGNTSSDVFTLVVIPAAPRIRGLNTRYAADAGMSIQLEPYILEGGTQAWEIESDPALPAGLEIDPETGALSGLTETTDAGLYSLTWTVTTAGGSDTFTMALSLNFVPSVPLDRSGSAVSVRLPGHRGVMGVPTQPYSTNKEYGYRGLILESATREEDKKGLITGTAVFKAPLDLVNTIAPRVGSPHPFTSEMTAEKITISYGNGWATISAQYAGMAWGDDEETPEPTYSMSIGTNDEPIENHPDFTEWVGTASKPKKTRSGKPIAIFRDGKGNITTSDEDARFDGFTIVEDNPFKGIERYMEGSNITFREQYVTRWRPIYKGKVGKIDTPPGKAPPSGPKRSWIYVGMSYEERGRVFTVTNEWRLSKPGQAEARRKIYGP